MAVLELHLDELILDEENPRIGEVQSQAAAIEAIYNLNARHFENMMQSIKAHGLDPGDAFYVIVSEEDENDYVVLEGNRRLAALKVLYDPNVLRSTKLSESAKKKLSALANGFELSEIEPFRCAQFDGRAEANEWIERRHAGALDGEGRVNWTPLEIQRFQKDRTVLDNVEFAERNWDSSNGDWTATRKAIHSNSSTFRRLVESSKIREWLGLVTKEEDGASVPYFARDPKFVMAVISRILSDIRDGVVDTRSLNKASDVAAYFDDLPGPLRPKGTKTKAVAFKDSNIQPPAKKPEKPAKKATKVKPIRRTLAPRTHPFLQPKTPKGQQLVREASRIMVLEERLAAAFVLRAFLQHTIDEYMHTNRIPFRENDRQGRSQELNLGQRAERVLDHLVANDRASNQDLRGVRTTLTGKTDPASIQSLNDYNHSRYRMPDADSLRNAWDGAEPLFIAVYGGAS